MSTPRFRLTALSILALALLSLPHAGDEFDLMRGEQIGPLKIGLAEAQVTAKLGARVQKGRVEKWEADGEYHQKWTFEGGVEVGMVAEKRGGAGIVESVTISAPCTFETKRGIRVGSPESDVLKAYKDELDRESSKAGESWVAGSVYGGLIFTIKGGKVNRMFLGAAAE